VALRVLCSCWALGRYLRAATSRSRDITTPGSKAPARHDRVVSTVERFHTLHEHALAAYDADHQLSLVAQRGGSARSSAFGCWRCWNPNLNPNP
jgi:hypothetical protein